MISDQLDRLAYWWLDRRRDQQIETAKLLDPEAMQFHITNIEAKQDLERASINIAAIAPSVVIMAEEAGLLLEAHNAKNYFQFDMMPRLDRGVRPIRVTVQWAYGESPASKNARLEQEIETLREQIASEHA